MAATALIVVMAARGAALAWRPAIAPAPAPPGGFAHDAVVRGAAVAALGDYVIALDLPVEHETGRIRIGRVAAVDSGQPINPDGIRNQIEGAIVQSASWTLYEQVEFTPAGVVSRDWSGYPVLRFPAAPDSVEVHIMDRPGRPFLGTGEAGQGPMAAVIANALRNAAGVRLRDLPLSPARVKSAIGV